MRAFLVVLLLLLAGCSSGPDLDGKTFTSTEVTGHDLVADSTIRLTFDDGNMSANAGCNTMSADYELDDGTLRWTGAVASTVMGCTGGLAEQDQWLTELLTDGVDAELDDTTLTLTDGDVEIVLEAE